MTSRSHIDPTLLDPVLSAAAMRKADAFTIDALGIPGFTLMESAGRATVAAIASRWGPFAGKHVVVACGRGNNGGDGFVVARGLIAHGARVSVITTADAASMSEDASLNFRILERLTATIPPGRLALIPYESTRSLDSVDPASLYVDALLGTGIERVIDEPVRSIVSWLNSHDEPVVAVDIPTGLHADHGLVLGAAVTARLTVTMGALKSGLLFNEGPEHAGEVVIAEIGIPRSVLDENGTDPSCGFRSTDEAVRALLPGRTSRSHKYSVGMTLAVAGSPGLSGAPVMASLAAARIGSGAVVCACHQAIQPVLASKLTEVMTLGLPGNDDGLDADASFERLEDRMGQAAALLVGCGLGRDAGTQALVRRLIAETELPLVLDADGIVAMEGHAELLTRYAGGRVVLTPHAGEFRRLSGEVDLEDRVEVARTWSTRWNSVLVLKGLPTVVAATDGNVYICGTGGPALATAGTGDVLAGMIAGLLAQGLSPDAAAMCAVHIGGACADAYSGHFSSRSMQAMDLLEQLPVVLKARFEPEKRLFVT